MPKIIVLIGFLLVIASSQSNAGAIEDYYVAMVDKGRSPFPQFSRQETVGGKKTFLVVGSIFSFIGKRSTVQFPVDALIISTNVDLRLDAASPRVQRRLANLLPKSQRDKVQKEFRRKGDLRAVTEALMVNLGDFSPRHVCFLATDRSGGGTYDDPEWQRYLEFDKVGGGVKLCLDQLREVRAVTIITPLIGSSINPLVERKKYVQDEKLRNQHIERRVRSLQGIISGLEKSEPASGEFGIIVWDKDVQRIIDPKHFEAKKYRDRHDASGFWGFKTQMLRVIEFAGK